MAFIMQQAGGKGSTGKENLLDIVPKSLHEPRPVFLGSREDVDEIERLYKAAA